MKTNIFKIIFFFLISFNLFSQNEPSIKWTKQVKFNSHFASIASTIDSQGYLYMAAISTPSSSHMVDDSIPLSPSSSQNQYSESFGYISKHESNGDVLWAFPLTRFDFDGSSGRLLTDDQGSVYFYGSYFSNKNAPAFLGDSMLIDTSVCYCDEQGSFLIKLNHNGELLWSKKSVRAQFDVTVMRPYNEEIPTLSFDLNGDIRVLGPFQNYISFREGDTLFSSNIDEVNAFYVKYSPSGEVLKSKILERGKYYYSPFQSSEKFRTDASGNIYRFSTRPNIHPKTLYRYDSEGEFLDSLLIPISSSSQYGVELLGFDVSSAGDVYIAGLYFGHLTLEDTYYPSYGGGSLNFDAVLFKLSAPNYDVDWVKMIQTADKHQFDFLNVDDLENIYALGSHRSGIRRLIFQKYTNDGTLLWDLPLVPPPSFTTPTSLEQALNGGNILVGGSFKTFADFNEGYTFSTSVQDAHDGFLIQFGHCNTPNPTIDAPITTQLCGTEDSLLLSATLDNPNDFYFWSTPNGKVAIDSNATDAELMVGQVGKYSLIRQEDEECYGKSQEIWVTRVDLPDTAVTLENAVLTATDTVPGTTYQWIDCQNNNTPIFGAANPVFEPTQNGQYAVVVTAPNGCSDTSSCYEIKSLGIENNPLLDGQITLYPNPTSSKVSVQTDLDISKIYVLDLQGKKLQTSNTKEVDLSKLSSGIYLIKVALKSNESWTSKVIKR